MTKKTNKPRGEGQYHARVKMGCAFHPAVDVVLSAADDSSWRIARAVADQNASLGIACLRCTTWFVREPWNPVPPDAITGDQIEDDMPF